MKDLLAIWGNISPPPGVNKYGSDVVGGASGLQLFISNGVKTIIAFAGVYAFFNILFAGYAFMSAGGNPEKIGQAWSKIYQTMIGLLVAAGSFVLAALFGYLIFKDPNALIQIRIFTP